MTTTREPYITNEGKCSCGGEIEIASYALICKNCGYEYQTNYDESRGKYY